MRYTFITLFPELIRPWLEESLIAKALQRGLLSAEVVDLRAFGLGRHRSVDDTPYGGGAGMVIRADVAVAAIESALPADEVILLSPAGRPFTQEVAEELSRKEHLVLLCGRYEGFDARVEAFVTRSISIGDYVLMGGEVAALAVLEATARLVPGGLAEMDREG
jgi:tRNA (guanine37-N1)-methyltransferase